MSVLSIPQIRESQRIRIQPLPRPAGTGSRPHISDATWGNFLSLTSLAAIVGMVFYILLSRL